MKTYVHKNTYTCIPRNLIYNSKISMQPKCSRTDDGRTYGFFIQQNATQQYEERNY